jgi:hypothetical protein
VTEIRRFVRFTTDAGNAGLTSTIASPGFYAEWSIVDAGQECDTEFTSTPGMGITGHNNEALDAMTPEQCMAECCKRQWCKSFDYIASDGSDPNMAAQGIDPPGLCNLADVDVHTNQAAAGPNRYNVLYEKAEAAIHGEAVCEEHGYDEDACAAIGCCQFDDGECWSAVGRSPCNPALGTTGLATNGLGPNGCARMLQRISDTVNHECCPEGGCANGMPETCSEECAGHWMPFIRQCSSWLAQQATDFSGITDVCEREQYGRYRPGSNHGRCSDGDLTTYVSEFAPACCGESMEFCRGRSMLLHLYLCSFFLSFAPSPISAAAAAAAAAAARCCSTLHAYLPVT